MPLAWDAPADWTCALIFQTLLSRRCSSSAADMRIPGRGWDQAAAGGISCSAIAASSRPSKLIVRPPRAQGDAGRSARTHPPQNTLRVAKGARSEFSRRTRERVVSLPSRDDQTVAGTEANAALVSALGWFAGRAIQELGINEIGVSSAKAAGPISTGAIGVSGRGRRTINVGQLADGPYVVRVVAGCGGRGTGAGCVGDVVIKVCSASRARLGIGRGYQCCQAGKPGRRASRCRRRAGGFAGDLCTRDRGREHMGETSAAWRWAVADAVGTGCGRGGGAAGSSGSDSTRQTRH